MSQPVSFWKRVENMFRGRGAASSLPGSNGNGRDHADQPRHAGAQLDADSTVALLEPAAPASSPARDVPEPSEFPRTASSMLRWGRRETKIEKLQQGYERVIEMMDAMQQHFEKQDRRAEELTTSVNRVAGTLEGLSETQNAQGSFLRSIAEHAQQSGKHAAALCETLGRMPSSLQAQADALRSVAMQLEHARESDSQLAVAMQRFEQAVDSLRASGAAQVETLQRMHVSEREQKEALTTLVRDQGRRYFYVLLVAAIFGLGALAAMAVALAMVIGR